MAAKKVAAKAALSLPDKVAEALSDLLQGRGNALRLEDVNPDKVAGTIVSTAFSGMTGTERQDLIWESLDKALTPYERTKIVIILAETPREHKVLHDDEPPRPNAPTKPKRNGAKTA